MSIVIPPTADADKATGTKGSTATRTTGGTLGKDDFLKLMVAQMANMDPLASDSSDPSKSTEQMTQFSILEQLTNLNSGMTSMAGQSSTNATLGLIGHNVSYSLDDGTTLTGKVESVQTAGANNTITIDGKAGIDPGRVIEVR